MVVGNATTPELELLGEQLDYLEEQGVIPCSRREKSEFKEQLSTECNQKNDPNLLSSVKKEPCQESRLLCDVCNNPNYVDNETYGLKCCRNCYCFIRSTILRNKNYACPSEGGCPVEWVRNTKGICGSCRWAKIINHDKFDLERYATHSKNQNIDTSSSDSELSDRNDNESTREHRTSNPRSKKKYLIGQCDICDNPNYLFKRNYGLITCLNCHDFIRRTLNLKKTYQCFDEGNCPVRWREHMKKLCSACRWKKIFQHPNFDPPYKIRKTLLSISVVEKQQNSLDEMPNGLYCRKCEICEKPDKKFSKIFGPLCCMNCRNFIVHGAKGACIGRGNCPLKWFKGNARGICGFCRWKKICSHPKFKRERLVDCQETDATWSSSGSESDQEDNVSHIKESYPDG